MVAPDKLLGAINCLPRMLKERTIRMFGLPDGEICEFELVTDKPWSGFNWLSRRTQVTSRHKHRSAGPLALVAHLVAHEAYPGHHTEHCGKETGPGPPTTEIPRGVDLPRRHATVSLGEGLADLGLEVAMGPLTEAWWRRVSRPSASATTPTRRGGVGAGEVFRG